MIVETTTVVCINDLYVENNGKKIKLYDKNMEYKFIRVNKSEWICRDEDILALCTHVISEEVKAYADFSRHILVLSSDSEVILEDYEKKCSKEQKKAIEHAVSLYKYCDDYGYIKPTDISIEL